MAGRRVELWVPSAPSRRGDVAATRKMANRSGDRNWGFYLAVVAAALLTLRRIRPSAIRLVAQFLPLRCALSPMLSPATSARRGPWFC